MKALFRKEFRENARLLVLGLIVFVILLLVEHRDFNDAMKSLPRGDRFARGEILQPLVAPLFQLETGFFCAIFGAVLGWLQMHHERHRDLWSFLVHRPMTRTGLFLGKIAGGLAVYAIGAGLPLAGFIVWARLPGNVPAPFEGAMLLPVMALFLLGVVYYFAGMLTGLRSARWCGSRGIPLGTALLATFASISMARPFAEALLVILIAGALLATAVWGAFHGNGSDRGQPAAGRAALAATLTFGAVVIAFLAMNLLITFLPRTDGPYRRSQYGMFKDGTLYRFNQEDGVITDVVDLEGKPLKDQPTGQAVAPTALNQRASRNVSFNVGFGEKPDRQEHYMVGSRHFSLWQATPDTIWYYWARHGRLVAYDAATRRFVGSLGPESFATNLRGNGDHFDRRSGFMSPPTTATTVYRVDLEQRRCIPLFTTTKDDPIGRAMEVQLDGYRWDYTVVATRQFIHLLTPDGKVVWKTPYAPGYPDYSSAMVSFLEPQGQFALWLSPSRAADARSGWKLPTHVTWLAGGQIVKAVDLPNTSIFGKDPGNRDRLFSFAMPSALLLLSPWLDRGEAPAVIPWAMVRVSLAVAVLICLPLSWWLGWRYRVPLGARLGWALFLLPTGIPGLLAFLSLHEWPAREACPQCRRLRVVDREQCEHCGAGFAPPERKGTEIFAPAGVAP
jgi:hypothetical protein